jgi:hypothetical protein
VVNVVYVINVVFLVKVVYMVKVVYVNAAGAIPKLLALLQRTGGAEGMAGVRTDALNFFLASVSVEVPLRHIYTTYVENVRIYIVHVLYRPYI